MDNFVEVRNFLRKSKSSVAAVRKALLITAAIGFCAPSALAQVAVGLPKNIDSDDNSISYSSGLPVISEKILSIGSSENGLEHIRNITGNRYWIHNYTIAVTGSIGGNIQVIIGSRTINFFTIVLQVSM